MDKASCWTWTSRRKSTILSPLRSPTAAHLSYSYHKDSWEEQAFAEDSAGAALGGCIWPPRSYTCSFCRREFRSAQALGGHMNVHRRDRARLRQSPPWAAQDSNTPNTNPNPKQSENPDNPKPSCASSSSSSRPYPITYAFPNLVSSPSSLACISPSPPSTSSASDARIAEMVLSPPAPLLGTLLSQGHASRTREEAVEPVKLDLEIGLCGNPATGDLDLELRLGYS